MSVKPKPTPKKIERPQGIVLPEGDCVCGLDPGLNGGIAVLSASTGECQFRASWPTEEVDGKTRYLLPEVYALIKACGGDRTLFCLERQQAMPLQGTVSMFSTGYGFGMLEMALVSLGARYHRVQPKAWQAVWAPFMPKRRKKDKKASKYGYRICEKLWPELDLRDPRKPKARKPHDGICDALLMAEAVRRGGVKGIPE